MSNLVKGFAGFHAEDGTVALPAALFSELLSAVDDLVELKLTLFLLRARAQADSPPLFSLEELGDTLAWSDAPSGGEERRGAEALRRAIERAVARGTLIQVAVTRGDTSSLSYLVNDDAGRILAQSMEIGQIADAELADEQAAFRVERPNVFVLYEQNIGLLQPLIVDELRQAEKLYPVAWIEDAFRIAAERNVRNWRYIRAILERWAREGRHDEADQDNPGTNRRRYIEGKHGHLVKH